MPQSFKFKLILMQVAFHLVLPLTTEVCHLWDDVNRTDIRTSRWNSRAALDSSRLWFGFAKVAVGWSVYREAVSVELG